MRALSRLRPEAIAIDPPWRSFRDTVEGLVATLATSGELPRGSEAETVAAVLAREADASTALLDIRTGIPHGRLRGLSGPALAIAVSADGLYEAVPTVAIQIVVLVVSPPDSGPDHLDALAGIATLLRSQELRAALLAARTGDDALALLNRHARPMP